MAVSILAWPGAIAGGVSLGLLGCGGSIPKDKLKKGFGLFLAVMGIYILARSLPEALSAVKTLRRRQFRQADTEKYRVSVARDLTCERRNKIRCLSAVLWSCVDCRAGAAGIQSS